MKKFAFIANFACLMTLFSMTLLSGEAQAKNSSIVVSGWYNDGWDPTSHAVYHANNDLFSDANPFWYNLGTAANAPGNAATDGSVYERSYAYNAAEVAQIHANGDKCVPAISDAASGQINTIFANATARQTLINNLVNIAVARNYDGWDIDFEYGVTANGGKAAYTAFIRDLAAALKARGKVLDVTLGAFENSTYESYWIMDLAGLKALANVRYFKIMAYDKCLRTPNVPNPLGELNWVKACLNYMVVTRGLPAGKVLLGIPNYAWVWKKAGSAYTLQTPFQSYNYIASQTGVTTAWNATYAESTATWSSGTYLAYYSDNKSVSARLDVIRSYGLKGAAFFVLGREDPAIYTVLRTKYPPV